MLSVKPAVPIDRCLNMFSVIGMGIYCFNVERFLFLQNIHWTDLIASTDKTSIHEILNITEVERKRRESVWELFKSECVFLVDHLMVLKHVSRLSYSVIHASVKFESRDTRNRHEN